MLNPPEVGTNDRALPTPRVASHRFRLGVTRDKRHPGNITREPAGMFWVDPKEEMPTSLRKPDNLFEKRKVMVPAEGVKAARCTTCKLEIPMNSRFCSHCGAKSWAAAWYSLGKEYRLSLPGCTLVLRPNVAGKLDWFEVVKWKSTFKATFDDLPTAAEQIGRLISEDNYRYAVFTAQRLSTEVKLLFDSNQRYVQSFLHLTFLKIAKTDEYGDERWGLLNGEVEKFLMSKLRLSSPSKVYEVAQDILIQQYRQYHVARKTQTISVTDVSSMAGEEFELYVAGILREMGFESVATTSGSGDFGADLVIRHKGRTIVVQCKRTASSVGVQAVQEVIGAKSHYAGDSAWVIVSSSFTRQAKALANSAGVHLHSVDELRNGSCASWL